MSLAITHFSLGASVACAILLATGRYRDPGTVLVVYLGGIFAMVPDLWRFVPFITRAHHASLWSNIFIGHQFFDQIDPGDSHGFAVVLLGVMGLFVCLITVARTRHHRSQPTADALPRPSDE